MSWGIAITHKQTYCQDASTSLQGMSLFRAWPDGEAWPKDVERLDHLPGCCVAHPVQRPTSLNPDAALACLVLVILFCPWLFSWSKAIGDIWGSLLPLHSPPFSHLGSPMWWGLDWEPTLHISAQICNINRPLDNPLNLLCMANGAASNSQSTIISRTP